MNKVALAVVISDYKILVVQRRIGDALLWQFPGGTIEVNESELEAVAREVSEETSIICEPLRKMGERVHPVTKMRIAYYLCRFIEGKAELNEPDGFERVAWMTPQEVLRCFDNLFEPIRYYLEALVSAVED